MRELSSLDLSYCCANCMPVLSSSVLCEPLSNERLCDKDSAVISISEMLSFRRVYYIG